MNEELDLNEMYNEIIEDALFQESIMQKIKKLGRNSKDALKISQMWEKSKKISKRKKWESDEVDDATFDKIQQEIKTVRNCTSYFVYKNSFDKLCKLCHIPSGQGVVIMDYELKKGVNNKNKVKITWADGRHKIQIPHGAILYHRSPDPNISELTPRFKGKAARGFLYDTPRVYLTIKAHMPKLAADIYKGDTYMYIADDNIKYAYVDPLLRSSMFGAVYVDTKTPIKVKKLTPELVEKIKKRYD